MKYFFILFCTFFYIEAFLFANIKTTNRNKPQITDSKTATENTPLKCNFGLTNPKKVINRYRSELENQVQSKPFGSICLKCSMCLAIAKEMHKIFNELSATKRASKQTDVVDLLYDNLHTLCSTGFENYDLRKFDQHQIVSDEFKCSIHVRTKMDGKWTEKLREICATYVDSMNVQYLLNDYLNDKHDISNYVCNNDGIFRDCQSLDLKNTSISPDKEDMCN